MKYLLVILALALVNSKNAFWGATIPVDLATFRNEALDTHNKYRKMHHVSDLALLNDLNTIAQNYAEYLADTNTFTHSQNRIYNGKPYGENLYMCWGYTITGALPTDRWYAEVSSYDYNNPGFSSETGHFTQVVWKGSQYVGFGVAKSTSGSVYIVGNYFPAGNYLGQFPANVLPI